MECLACPNDYKCEEGAIRPEICTDEDTQCQNKSERRELATSCAAGKYSNLNGMCIICPEGYT